MGQNAGPALPGRREVMRRWRAEGGAGAVAVLPVHAPRALFRAFGLLPVEVWGPPGARTARAEAHLQAYTCSIVRASLGFLMEGGLDAVDAVVVPHACDSLQGLGSVLTDFPRSDHPVLTFYLPRAEGPEAVDFAARELRRLYDALAALTGRRPGDDALAEAVALDERADAAFDRLLDARPRLPLGDLDFYRVARAREYLPAEEFADLVVDVLRPWEAGGEGAGRPGPAPEGIPVLLSGIVPEPMELLGTLTDAGGRVVADDFAAVGRRRYPPGTDPDPLRRMAERLLGGAPDSTRGSAVRDRAEHLLGLARRHGARAVVFWGVKFCEPELFYLPLLRRALDAAGLPSTVLEVELDAGLPHQAVTRLEALLESVA